MAWMPFQKAMTALQGMDIQWVGEGEWDGGMWAGGESKMWN